MTPQVLLPAINSAKLPVSVINDNVRRILREVVSFGFLDIKQLDPSTPLDDPRSELAALNTAREGIVLLKNEGSILPLKRNQVRSFAVLGPAARGAPPTGFGSSFVTPISFVSELDGIRKEAGAQVTVDFIADCTLDPATAPWNSSTPTDMLNRDFRANISRLPILPAPLR